MNKLGLGGLKLSTFIMYSTVGGGLGCHSYKVLIGEHLQVAVILEKEDTVASFCTH